MDNDVAVANKDNELNFRTALQKIMMHLENIPFAIIEWNKYAQVVYWSSQAEKILGWKSEEVLGKYIYDIPFIYEEDIPNVEKYTDDVFKKGLTYFHNTNRNYTKTKQTIYCEWYNSALKDDNGIPTSIFSFFYDVTDRKEAEEKLKHLKEHLDLLMKATNDSFWEYDIKSKKVIWNESIRKLYGFDLSDELNESLWSSRVHPKDKERVDSAFAETLAQKKDTWITEYRFLQPDNSYKYLMDRGYVQYDNEGQPVKIIGSTVDITELKEAEEKIQKSNERFHLISKATNDGIWEMDLNSNEVWWSDQVYQIFGFDRNQKPMADTWMAKIHPDDRARVYDKYITAQKEGKSSWTNEYRMESATGSYLTIFDRCFLLYNDEGKATRLIGATMDISERKENERQLKEANKQLQELYAYMQQVREQERTTIARELHDELGQQLTALRMDFASLIKKCENVSYKYEDRITNIYKLMDEMSATIRHISSELRPSILDDLGLKEAIIWQKNEFQKRSGIKCNFISSGNVADIPSNKATALFRIFQESLTNIGRHSNATEMNAELIINNHTIYLSIHDNGKGFDVNAINKKRTFGLLGMRERANTLGGQFDVVSGPVTGTQINVTLPL